MTSPEKRASVAAAVADLTAARERVESLLAEGNGPEQQIGDLLGGSRALISGLRNTIELEEIKRTEERALKASTPSTANQFADVLSDLFSPSREANQSFADAAAHAHADADNV